MSLSKERILAEFKGNHLPKAIKEIHAAFGNEVEVHVDWGSITQGDDTSDDLLITHWGKVYFEPLIAALKAIGKDELGRKALAKGVKKIVIQNKSGNYSSSNLASLSQGVLTIDHEPASNVDDVKDRTEGLSNFLNESLTSSELELE